MVFCVTTFCALRSRRRYLWRLRSRQDYPDTRSLCRSRRQLPGNAFTFDVHIGRERNHITGVASFCFFVFFQWRSLHLCLFGVSASHSLGAMTEIGLRVALGISHFGGTLGPSIAIGVQGYALNSEPVA